MLSRPLFVCAVLFCQAFNVQAASVDYVVWSQTGGIFRAQPNGTDVQPVAAGFEVRGIALDPSREQILWSEVEPRVPIGPTGSIRSATLAGQKVHDIVRNLPRPSGVAIDSNADLVYWTDLETSQIMRAGLNGVTATETLIDTIPSLSLIHDLALDVSGDSFYFSYVNPLIDSLYPGAIARARLDGSGLETIVSGLTEPWGIALDPATRKLYWTDNDLQAGGVIRRANLDGSQREDIVAGLKSPRGIALDTQAGYIYWANTDAGSIQRADLDGQHVVNVLTGLDRPEAVALSFVPEPNSRSIAWALFSTWVLVTRSGLSRRR